MAQHRSDSAELVAETANRLRMVQFDLADQEPQVRQDYLADELRRALAEVPPAERQQFLERLEDRFPSWDRQVAVASRAEEAVPRSSVDERELSDASFLVSRLTEVLPSLNEAERQVVRDRLAAAGLGPAPTVAWRDDAVKTLSALLDLEKTAAPDPDRALAAVDLLMTAAIDLDKMIWKTWREIAPKEKLRESGKLKSNLARWLGGDEDISRTEVGESLENLRRMIASMILAIRNAPREWTHRHLEKMSVAAIESHVDFEGTKLLESREVKCWRKYRELAEGLDEISIAREILQVVAEYAGRILEGART
ncbi:MAG: hypothetical protein JSV91_13440 [Phycisphaerales bacterium]|nr:MAG: hypothetical protein JSV91_13440 [Phycisphaerales bacterium]